MNIYFLIFWATLTYLDFSDFLAVLYGRNLDMHSLNCKWNIFLFEFHPFFKSYAFYQTQKPTTEELNDITAGYDSLYDGNPPAGCPSGCALMEYVKILSVLKGSVGRKLCIVKKLRERGSSKHCYIHDECLTSKSDLSEKNNRPYTCL